MLDGAETEVVQPVMATTKVTSVKVVIGDREFMLFPSNHHRSNSR